MAKVFFDNQKDDFERMLLRPKTSGKINTNKNYPIVAVLRIDNNSNFDFNGFNPGDAKFMEWGYLKPNEGA